MSRSFASSLRTVALRRVFPSFRRNLSTFSGDLIHTVQIPPSSSTFVEASLCLVRPGAYVVSQWLAEVETLGYDRGRSEFRGEGRETFRLVGSERREVIEVQDSSSL
jgi:hypothetical protein